MRVLLTGGGTSGHVTPALAIADIIKKNDSSAEFAYIGTPNGIERRLVEKEGMTFYPINIQGVRRPYISLSNVKTAYLMMTSQLESKKIIEKFKPDIVIGTGGYVCWAPLKVASEMGIPTMIHESNAIAGLATRRVEDKVDIILTNFKQTANTIKHKSKVRNVGNPIRKVSDGMEKAEARKKLGISDDIKFVVLSFGGSLGAPKINEAAIDVMRGFDQSHSDVAHYHSGGKNYYKNAMQLFVGYSLEKKPNLDIKEYIYNMPLHMAAADVVICRAGAMTLTEIAINRKPAILIPSPNVTDGHQYKNAKALADKGAAILIGEEELDFEKINSVMQELYENNEKRMAMTEALAEFANPYVDDQIYEEIKALIRNKSKIKIK